MTQDGQSDVFFTGMPLEIHYIITSRDMDEKDYSLKLSAYSGNPVFSDVPIFMMGLYDDDQVLGIGISKDELDKIQNAEDYFDRTIRETIPFNVPLRITFDKYWGG